MKVLFCSPIPSQDQRLGASRVIVDLAEAWRGHGWECDVYAASGENVSFADYPGHLRNYLQDIADDYDVVDFPYSCEPWIESRHSRVLKVARAVLLQEHCQFNADPRSSFSFKSCIAGWLRFRARQSRRKALQLALENRKRNIASADLITVGNSQDKQCLSRLGVSPEKVIVVPYGLTERHKERLFFSFPGNFTEPTIVFLGTFDYRKGCQDFAAVLSLVSKAFPQVKLKLIGTKGMCPNAEAVYSFFPRKMHDRISVVPTFAPEELPELLNGCAIGMFPSYREGFGIGVVEMLAAGLPVIAYDVPGPCDILPEEWLAERGDVAGLASRMLAVLRSGSEEATKDRARSIAGRFLWSDIARQTHSIYQKTLNEMR